MRLILVLLFLASATLADPILFDNGGVDTSNPTWNMTAPTYTVWDDFVLASDSTLTEIVYNSWHTATNYVSTNWEIRTALPGSGSSLASGATAGTFATNGLSSGNRTRPTGFIHTLAGLSVALDAGTYYLGLSSVPTFSQQASIASGNGTGSSLSVFADGSNVGVGTGDHMSFKVNGNVAHAAEPSTVALFGLAAVGAWFYRRRRNAS